MKLECGCIFPKNARYWDEAVSLCPEHKVSIAEAWVVRARWHEELRARRKAELANQELQVD